MNSRPRPDDVREMYRKKSVEFTIKLKRINGATIYRLVKTSNISYWAVTGTFPKEDFEWSAHHRLDL